MIEILIIKLCALVDDMKKNPNFLHTLVWPEYANVLEFYKSDNCLAAITDSGGVQEEMNLLGKPCFTVRFSTDRPETVMHANGNLLIPPISAEFFCSILDHALNDEKLLSNMSSAKKLYGNDVAKRFISVILELMKEKRKSFSWSHDELGF